jgi:hypothetical protein
MDNKLKDGVSRSPASKASLIPPIAIAIGLLLMACSNKKKIERDFYLPADFEGTVFVVFGIPGFPMAEKDQEGNYVFKIPDSGVLLVGNEFENGLTRYRYFTYCNGRAYQLKRMNPNGYCEDTDCENFSIFKPFLVEPEGGPESQGIVPTSISDFLLDRNMMLVFVMTYLKLKPDCMHIWIAYIVENGS